MEPEISHGGDETFELSSRRGVSKGARSGSDAQLDGRGAAEPEAGDDGTVLPASGVRSSPSSGAPATADGAESGFDDDGSVPSSSCAPRGDFGTGRPASGVPPFPSSGASAAAGGAACALTPRSWGGARASSALTPGGSSTVTLTPEAVLQMQWNSGQQISELSTACINLKDAQRYCFERLAKNEENTQRLKEGLERENEDRGKLTSRVERLEKEHVQNTAASRFKVDELTKKVFPLIPQLMNTKRGTMAYCPVKYVDSETMEEKKLIFFSIPMAKQLMEMAEPDLINLQTGASKDVVRTLLRNELGRHCIRLQVVDFMKLILKTPFKPYKIPPSNCSKEISKGNFENYIVLDSNHFRRFCEEIRAAFPESNPIPDSVWTLGISAKSNMIQRWSMMVDSKGEPSRIEDLKDRTLTEDERKGCPAMCVEWGLEWFDSGTSDYFEMTSGQPKHVVNGLVVDETVEATYADVLAQLAVPIEGVAMDLGGPNRGGSKRKPRREKGVSDEERRRKRRVVGSDKRRSRDEVDHQARGSSQNRKKRSRDDRMGRDDRGSSESRRRKKKKSG